MSSVIRWFQKGGETPRAQGTLRACWKGILKICTLSTAFFVLFLWQLRVVSLTKVRTNSILRFYRTGLCPHHHETQGLGLFLSEVVEKLARLVAVLSPALPYPRSGQA